MEKMTASEAALHFKVSSQTIRRWIQSGKLNGIKENDQWHVEIDQQHHATSVEHGVAHDVEHLMDEIRHLRELLERRDEEIDRLTQLLGLAQKSIDRLTEQNQLLLEDTRNKTSFFQRVKAVFAGA